MPKLMRLELLGDGTDENPYRVSLPTYTMLDVDYAAKWAVVEVPDADVPDTLPAPTVPERVVWNGRAVRNVLPPGFAATWKTHLDGRYREHKGKFDPKGK